MRIILVLLLVILSATSFADTCPPVVTPKNIPQGWTLTRNDGVTQPMIPFDFALWNGNGDGRIDCAYFDTNDTILVITSNKSYPTPDAKKYPLWDLRNNTGWCNIMSLPIHPGQCTFG